jgi:hypothetical protein
LHFQLEGPEGRLVSVRVHDRQGQIHVAVHTTNPDHAKALRERAAELVGDIERHGFRAEMPRVAPPDSSGAGNWQERAGQREADPFAGNRDNPGGSGQQQRRQQPSRQQEPAPAASPDRVGSTWESDLAAALFGKE